MPWSPWKTVISRAATITALLATLLAAGCTGSASSGGGASAGAGARAGAGATTTSAVLPPSAATSPPPSAVKPLPKDVASLINLTNSAMTTGTFAATYRLTQAGKSGARTSRLVQKGARYRFEHAPDASRREVIVNNGKVIWQCQSLHRGPMKCQLATGVGSDRGTFGAEHPSMLMSRIESMNVLIGRGMRARTGKRTLLGMPLRCVLFQATLAGAAVREACVTPQGVIAYVHLDAYRLTMTRFTTKVSDSEFLPPR